MTGYLPERPREILKPIGNGARWHALTGDQLWASPGLRLLLWAVLGLLLFAALLRLRLAVFGFGPLLFAAAILLPPALFAVIVPPRGQPFLRSFTIGMLATTLLLLAVVVLAGLASLSQRGQALSVLLG